MTLIPCKIEDIPALTHPNRRDSSKASLLSFLAMEASAVKVEGISKQSASSAQSSLTQLIKKENLPIKAITRKGTLYLVNTAKVPEFAL